MLAYFCTISHEDSELARQGQHGETPATARMSWEALGLQLSARVEGELLSPGSRGGDKRGGIQHAEFTSYTPIGRMLEE